MTVVTTTGLLFRGHDVHTLCLSLLLEFCISCFRFCNSVLLLSVTVLVLCFGLMFCVSVLGFDSVLRFVFLLLILLYFLC